MNRAVKFVRAVVLAAVISTLLAAVVVVAPRTLAAEAKKKVEIKIRPIDSKAAAKVSFSRDIKPILLNNCVECHSVEDRKSNFEVTSVTTLKQKGKKAGAGVIPGKPDESSVVQYIRGLADGPQMPKGEPALSEEELHLIRSWIAAGAMDDSGKLAGNSSPTKSDAKISSSAALDEATQKNLNAFIFGNNKDEQFSARRALRLTLVPPSPQPPKVSGATFNAIDNFILAKWNTAKFPEAKKAPPVCNDATFIRRVYLDLIGVIPSAESTKKFVTDKTSAKRAKLIDSLLARNEEYAAHWTPFWQEALASTEPVGGVATHGNYTDFIYKSFLENKPYDLFVAELLDPTLPGHKKSSTANANGKLNLIGFVRNENHQDTIQSAANTAQVFLGTGMKCASCHSHFLNKEWPQARFLAFGGLFATNDLELIRCEKKSGQIIPAAFPFDLPNVPKEIPKEVDQRLHYLTTLLIDPANPRFAKAIVNRLWKRYLGLGLFEPVDDFRLDRAPSHPELLDWLADDFMRHGYDLKHTIRLILNSRTYQLRYNPALEDHFDVQKPSEPRYVRSPALRRLTAEQLLDSIHKATSKNWDANKRLYRENKSSELTRALGRPASRNEISTGRPDDVAVVQSLELLNGTELYRFVYSGEILDELASESDRKKVLQEIYWAVLNRAPTRKETDLGLNYLKKNLPVNNATEPLGDILWALVVSPEFQYIR